MGLPYSRDIAKGRTHRGPAGLIRLLTTMSCACDMGSSYAPRTYESLTDCLLLAYLYDPSATEREMGKFLITPHFRLHEWVA